MIKKFLFLMSALLLILNGCILNINKANVACNGETTYIVDNLEDNILFEIEGENEAIDFSLSFIEATSSICGLESQWSSDHKEALENIWPTYKSNFEAMSASAKNLFNTSNNETISKARSLYSHIVARYNLSLWNNGPTVNVSEKTVTYEYSDKLTTTMIAVVVIIAAFAITFIVCFTIIEKRKK